MGKFIDLTGQQFGRLRALKRAEKNKWGTYKWLCECECGQTTVVRGSNLKGGNIKSCGCSRIKHGHNTTTKISETYKTWQSMMQRCINNNDKDYCDYGGQGIIVCNRWKTFNSFLKDMGERPPKHSIDRINNDGNYCPENCRWATRKQQARNRHNNLSITYKGRTQLLIEWAKEYDICYRILWVRIYKLSWSVPKALKTLKRKYKKRKK